MTEPTTGRAHMGLSQAKRHAREVLQDVSELPDRTGPEDRPEMMLVTEHELFSIIVERLTQ